MLLASNSSYVQNHLRSMLCSEVLAAMRLLEYLAGPAAVFSVTIETMEHNPRIQAKVRMAV